MFQISPRKLSTKIVISRGFFLKLVAGLTTNLRETDALGNGVFMYNDKEEGSNLSSVMFSVVKASPEG